MKKILIAVIILLFSLPAYGQVELARMSPVMVGGGVPVVASCATCASYRVGGTCEMAVVQGTSNAVDYYVGQYFKPTANISVCKVSVYGSEYGDANFEYYVKIWDMSGGKGTLPANPLTNGTSDAVNASSWGASYAYRDFVWSGDKPSLISGTLYAITVDRGGVDGTDTNFIYLCRATVADLWPDADEDKANWKSDKDENGTYSNNEELTMTIYRCE